MAVGGIVKVVVCTGSSEIFSDTGTIERRKSGLEKNCILNIGRSLNL